MLGLNESHITSENHVPYNEKGVRRKWECYFYMFHTSPCAYIVAVILRAVLTKNHFRPFQGLCKMDTLVLQENKDMVMPHI